MRIWHWKLIPVLPNKQLLAMRYELGDMIKQYPNIKNPLVKYANNYDIAYLGEMFGLVLCVCNIRGINMKAKYNNEISRIVFDKTKLDMGAFNLRYKEHNKRYLKQCLYNLQEKYDRGIINESEWKKIKKIFRRKIK